MNFVSKSANRVEKPVICIGNVVSGGAGKTPIALEIGKILKELKIDFAYLSSGFGGKIRNFTQVKNQKSSEVGDEPLLLKEISDTFICKSRIYGARKIAAKKENQLIVVDDGLQNPSLIKDLNILVIDGNYGFGNGFLIPAGPMREPASIAINRSDLIIIIGEDKHQIAKKFCIGKKVIRVNIKAVNAQNFENKSVVAFCGIGRPEKFFESLNKNKTQVIAKFSYPDHHHYLETEINKMVNLANKNGTKLITTKKDWVRLEPKYQKQIEYFDIEAKFENEEELKEILKKLINDKK